MTKEIQTILDKYGSDKTRLMDILWDVQLEYDYISDESVASLAEGLNMSIFDVRETSTFYHFFINAPLGKHTIYLVDSVISRMQGFDSIYDVLEKEIGCTFNNVDATGEFRLALTNCAGVSDQEPAMLIDQVVFTRLTPEKVASIIKQLKQGKSAEDIVNINQSSKDTIAYIHNNVDANIQKGGPVFFKQNRDYEKLLRDSFDRFPDEIIEEVIRSNIRGRGGAGFPSGLKWRLGRDAVGETKYIICNADEGEPGTFKDRVLLMKSPKDILIGMILGGYAVGSPFGIIYLRAEYWYIKAFLEKQIQDFRDKGYLGKNILGSTFDFDIRIQMGAGSYVCGDETALIESCEGKRGTPRVKPPYPIQQGYLGMPTIVNNVETFAAISRIIEKGGDWFASMGTEDSTGTRLLSVSGDCSSPGIYEIEWGIQLNEVLEMVGAEKPKAVQISGPSGECASVKKDGARTICYSDLSCNGSFMIFDETRDILGIVHEFMKFFVDESCGICIPCRAGNVDLLNKVERVKEGKACQKDLEDFKSWGALLKGTSRCGLGTTSPNPILTTMEKFPEIYQEKLVEEKGPLLPSFDIEKAKAAHTEMYKQLMEVAK